MTTVSESLWLSCWDDYWPDCCREELVDGKCPLSSHCYSQVSHYTPQLYRWHGLSKFRFHAAISYIDFLRTEPFYNGGWHAGKNGEWSSTSRNLWHIWTTYDSWYNLIFLLQLRKDPVVGSWYYLCPAINGFVDRWGNWEWKLVLRLEVRRLRHYHCCNSIIQKTKRSVCLNVTFGGMRFADAERTTIADFYYLSNYSSLYRTIFWGSVVLWWQKVSLSRLAAAIDSHSEKNVMDFEVANFRRVTY